MPLDGMKPFEIGYVPAGWKRGDDLILRNALPNQYGMVSRRWVKTVGLDEVGALTFSLDQADAVRAWLEWW